MFSENDLKPTKSKIVLQCNAREITERFFELIKKQGVVKLPSHPQTPKKKANFTSKGREKGREGMRKGGRGRMYWNVKHGRRKKGERWAMT